MIAFLLLSGLCLDVTATLATLPAQPPNTVRLYFVRHGQARSNLQPPPPGPPDSLDHLTSLGKSQMERVAAALKARGVALILHSPAGRATESAAALAGALGLKPRLESRLRPLDLGRSAAGPLGFAARIAAWKEDRDPAVTAGESMQELSERLLGLVRELGRAPGPRSVALITHSEVIASLVGSLKDVPAPRRYLIEVQNASITVVDVPTGKAPLLVTSNAAPEAASAVPPVQAP
jgi:broad specificity phosphatase PhoE